MRDGGWHLLGTARMGARTPATSVIDQWRRSRHIPNLYVIDGSTFVTSSGVNPTIMALAPCGRSSTSSPPVAGTPFRLSPEEGHTMLTASQRDRFSSIADVLVPSAEGMPSVSDADVPTRWIDGVLRFRPDLADRPIAALDAAGDLPTTEAVELLNREHIPDYEALGTLTAGAPFLNPAVKQTDRLPASCRPPRTTTWTPTSTCSRTWSSADTCTATPTELDSLNRGRDPPGIRPSGVPRVGRGRGRLSGGRA